MNPVSYHRPDSYSRQAKQTGYAARSVFKLIEADRKYKLLRPGMQVLDLGCAPGSWCQYAAKQVGERGHVLGVDIKPISISLPQQASCHQMDIYSPKLAELLQLHAPFDLFLSDAAPTTSGIPSADAARSEQLASTVLELALIWLKPGRTLFAKIFQGQQTSILYNRFQQCFQEVRIVKPKASRPHSVEVFLLGKRLKCNKKPFAVSANPPTING